MLAFLSLVLELGCNDYAKGMLAALIGEVLLQYRISHPLGVAAALADTALGQRPRQAKITDLCIAFGVYQDVSGLQISVNNVGRVKKLHRTQQIVGYLDHMALGKFHTRGLSHHFFEVALDVLHHNKNAKLRVVFVQICHEKVYKFSCVNVVWHRRELLHN